MKYDLEELGRKKYLRSDEAAFLLGYDGVRYARPVAAFWKYVYRHRITVHKLGNRALFSRAELEAAIRGRT